MCVCVLVPGSQADELKESLATFQECSIKGLGYVDGACASRSWVIAEASDDVACTDDNTGALRYAVKGGGLELCAGKADGWYDIFNVHRHSLVQGPDVVPVYWPYDYPVMHGRGVHVYVRLLPLKLTHLC